MREGDLKLVFTQVAAQEFAQPRVVVDDQDTLGIGDVHGSMITGRRRGERLRPPGPYDLLQALPAHAVRDRLSLYNNAMVPAHSRLKLFETPAVCGAAARGHRQFARTVLVWCDAWSVWRASVPGFLLRRLAALGLGCLLAAVSGFSAGVRAEPSDAAQGAVRPRMLDHDERRRLRHEIREAYEMRRATGKTHAGHLPDDATPSQGGGPRVLHRVFDPPPGVPAMGMGRPHERGHAHGLNLSEVEREELRRQLREQRASRLEIPAGAARSAPAP